jgi:hypothetical protein
MNRAWIPVGALAGVSVAGLLALGPLTDSLGTQVVPFPASAAPTQPAAHVPASVPVSINVPTAVGRTETAALQLSKRGGKASATTSGTEGFTSLKINSGTQRTTSQATAPPSTTHATVTPPAAKPKKPVAKRPTVIGTVGETNSTSGLAGGGTTKTSVGEQSSRPAP